jgi:hypothetical protein
MSQNKLFKKSRSFPSYFVGNRQYSLQPKFSCKHILNNTNAIKFVEKEVMAPLIEREQLQA